MPDGPSSQSLSSKAGLIQSAGGSLLPIRYFQASPWRTIVSQWLTLERRSLFEANTTRKSPASSLTPSKVHLNGSVGSSDSPQPSRSTRSGPEL